MSPAWRPFRDRRRRQPLNVVDHGLTPSRAHVAWLLVRVAKDTERECRKVDMTSLAMSSESSCDTKDEDVVDGVTVVVQLLRRPRWQTLGACRGERVEMFIPDRGGPTARAKQLCARCTVRAECLRYALAVPDLVGYWAGTNERERRRLRAASRREKASA
jgi:WhiB family redox-sensing transcriptional regulator